MKLTAILFIHFFTAINFINENIGWMADGTTGGSGNILKPTEGGTTWSTQVNNPDDVFNEIYFKDENQTLAAGRFGKIRSKTNGVGNWVLKEDNIYNEIFSIALTRSGGYWLTGSEMILYSEDTGFPEEIKKDTNYYPLNLKNRWQYLRIRDDSDGSSYELYNETIESDTIITGNRYYKNSGSEDLIRYSIPEQKLFKSWNDSDYVTINFSLPDGTIYEVFYKERTAELEAEAGQNNLFNTDRIYSGYKYLGPSSWFERVYYTDSIGMTYSLSGDVHIGYENNIIAAIIYDTLGNRINYSNYYKPVFQIEPITKIDSSILNLNFKIFHQYTKVLTPNDPPWHKGVDFIDSVWMISYYSKNDSIIPIVPRIPDHILNPVNRDYSVAVQIDSELMKGGFSFNYRFIAKDKCIIPAYASSPDSGYYICTWDETVYADLEKEKLPKVFSLYQNYPNPFNPRTIIKYQIPNQSFISIKIYDILGREVLTLINDEKPAGVYEVEFNEANLPSGIYLYQLQSGNFMEVKKMILLK